MEEATTMPSERPLPKRSTTGARDVHPLQRARESVMEAERLRLAGKLERARSACLTLLKEFPDYLAALHTIGLVLSDQGQFDKALGYLHRASMLDPKDTNILTALSGVYLRLGFNLTAARTLEQARRLAPNDSNMLATLGEIYREEKEYELSRQVFEEALKADPSFTAAEIGLALNLVHIGELERAVEIFERKVREGARSISHLYMLSQMPRSLVSLDVASLLDEATPSAGHKVDDDFRAQLAFTKAAAFDKAGRYEEAWSQVREARRYNVAENRKSYQRLRQRQGPLLDLARRSPTIAGKDGNGGSDCPVSLFIVGPSRSGKTSLETLVGSLPGVKRGYENSIVENSVRQAFQRGALPSRVNLIELPPGLGDLFERYYREELAERAGSARVLTNTVPARNDDALRAAVEVPNARFIFVKRNINDITLRIYMRNYKSGNYYASDINDIREYLIWCHDMIDAMALKMPKICRVLSYEEMVADPASAVTQAAELCGVGAFAGVLPVIGDDRGCADPYRDHIEAALR
jgi:tetratricopeptide (TPR) repeat protein